MNKAELSRYLKAFSDQSRLTILELLAHNDLSVTELTDKIGLSQSAVSRHLAVLRAADVVIATRYGQSVVYSLNTANVTICCEDLCSCLQIRPKFGKRKK